MSDNKTSITEQFKEIGSKYSLSKYEYDLYNEEDDVAEKIYRVKRFSMPNRHEKWKFFLDTKVIFVVESTKISKAERKFLQTVEGFNFMLSQAKNGVKSFNAFRVELKKNVKI